MYKNRLGEAAVKLAARDAEIDALRNENRRLQFDIEDLKAQRDAARAAAEKQIDALQRTLLEKQMRLTKSKQQLVKTKLGLFIK
jgi:hypothetical protein